MIKSAILLASLPMSTEGSSNLSSRVNFYLALNVENERLNATAPNPAQPVVHVEHPKTATSSQKEVIMHQFNNHTNYANFAQKTCD